MTIIAAYADNDYYWIGSDSYGFIGDTTGVNYGSKLIKFDNYIVAFSGSYKIADVIKEAKMPKSIKNFNGVKDFRDILSLEVFELWDVRDISDKTCTSLLLATEFGIYTLESDYKILKNQDKYAAEGAGMDFALGALSALKERKEQNGKLALKATIKATIKHCTTAAGRIYIDKVRRVR